PACERPRPPPVGPEPFGDGGSWQRGELAQLPHPQPLELRVAIGMEREQRERERREELPLLLSLDDENLPGTCDARRRAGGEPAPGSPRTGTPGSSAGGQRSLERLRHTSVEPFDASRLEDDRARLDRLDGEPDVLEPPQHALPLPLDGGGIGV